MSDRKKIYALIAVIIIAVILVLMYRREHASNVDIVGEALVLSQRVGDPTESAILMDIAKQNEHLGNRGDESDAPYKYNMHLISTTPDFTPYEKIGLEHFRNNTELIDLLTA